jgi:hypothetical protein
MASPRLAKITIRASFSIYPGLRGEQAKEVRLRLAGQDAVFRLGAYPAQYEFALPDANSQDLTAYMKDGITNLITVIRAYISDKKLSYQVSDVRFIGYDPSDAAQSVVEFDVASLAYDRNQDLDFTFPAVNPPGWRIMENLSTIKPITATLSVTDAGVFGTATGSAYVYPLDSNGPPYTYAWADDPNANQYYRTNLVAGTYFCTITDAIGASVRLTIVVKSDARLTVQVNTTANSVELVPSGGRPGYTYAWRDGPTTATRTGLGLGTYYCTVTDSHGATRDVEVVIARNTRYWFSGNPIVLSLDAGAGYRDDPTTKPGLSFVCEVFVEPVYLSGNFVQVGQTLEQPADAEGRTTFEVQELLEPFVSPVVPSLDQTTMQREDGLFCRFFLKHYERTTDGLGDATSVQTNYLVHGGLDFVEAASGTWFSTYQTAKKPFLTWEPIRKKVLPDQPEYLYFMVTPDALGPVSFRYRMRLTYANGRSGEYILAERADALAFEIFRLPAGPVQLDLAGKEANAGALVTFYTLDLLDFNGSPLSETRTYVLDRRPLAVRRYFLYANSLGGWNTFVCRGRASLDLATKTSTSENARAAGYNPLRGDYTINRRTGLPTLHCYSGARSAEQLVADRDFMLSERVLLLQDGRYLAGQVKDRTFVTLEQYETRRLVQFDYELPRERYYTPHLTV